MRTGTYVQHTDRAVEPYVLKQAEAATEIQNAEMLPDMKSKQGAISFFHHAQGFNVPSVYQNLGILGLSPSLS